MTALYLRPRSFSELIDATFQIVRARFSAIATVGAIMILPGAFITLVMLATMPDMTGAKPGQPHELGSTFWAIWAVAMPVGLVVYALGSAAMMQLASSAYLGRRMEVGEAFAAARRRFWQVLGSYVMKFVLVFAPIMGVGIVLALAIPAAASGGPTAGGLAAGLLGFVVILAWLAIFPILMLRWAVSTPVAALETVGPMASLSRSAALTKGSKARLFVLYAVFFVVGITMMAIGMMVAGLAGAVTSSLPVSQALGNVISLVFYPLLGVLQTVIYYDLRIRTEGFDLEVMAAGLEGGSLPAPATGARQPA